MQKSEKEKLVAKLRRAADAQRRAYSGNLYHEGIAQGLDDAAGILGKVRCEEEPTAEPKTGRWKPYPIADGCIQCSVCGILRVGEPSNFCPNCGADMRGEHDE